jgi:hypothetical protein
LETEKHKKDKKANLEKEYIATIEAYKKQNLDNVDSIINRITEEYETKKKLLSTKGDSNESVYVFRTLVGLPEGIDEAQYNIDWYNININNYGTKWDIRYDEFNFDFGDGSLSVSFETAWSPPEGFVRMLMEQYTGITFLELSYEEGGCDFAGKLRLTRNEETGEIYEDVEQYTFLEGCYKNDSDYFYSQAEDYLENDEYETLEEYLEVFDFLDAEADKEAIAELTNMFNEHKQEQDAE